MKACIFDLDGTLTDTLSSIAFYGNKALSNFGIEPIETEEYKYFLGDGRDCLIHRMLAYRNADTDENFKKVGADYDTAYENDVICLTKPFPGILRLLDDLKAHGVRLAVLSNKPDNVAVPIVEAIFKDRFDFAAGEHNGMRRKPASDGALLISQRLGVLPENCFFIGDTNVDIFTGQAAGMKTIGVLWGFRGRKELIDAGADFIASDAHDIYKFVTEDEG